jgi:transcriptional regulator with XRE-family HTH domain
MKHRILEGFGPRLARIRKGRGLSQRALGRLLGVSQRVIVYYERQSAQPPGALLVDVARVLKVSTDELLGIKLIKQDLSPRDARLLKRIQRIRELPKADQQAVLKFLDALIERHITARVRRSSRGAPGRPEQVASQ